MASSSIFKFIQFVGLLSLFSVLSACSEGPGNPGTGILYPEKLVIGTGVEDTDGYKFRYDDDGTIHSRNGSYHLRTKSLKMTITELKLQLEGEEFIWPAQTLSFSFLGDFDKKAITPPETPQGKLSPADHFLYKSAGEIDYELLTPKMKNYFTRRRQPRDDSPKMVVQFRLKSIEGRVAYEWRFKGSWEDEWANINFDLQPDVLVNCVVSNSPVATTDGNNRLIYFNQFALLKSYYEAAKSSFQDLIKSSPKVDLLTYDNARFKEENKSEILGTDPKEVGYVIVDHYLRMRLTHDEGEIVRCEPAKH